MAIETDVLLVGAGPTGLLLGCELARRGVSFRIIDKAGSPSHQSRALTLHSRTLEVLEDFALAERAVQAGFRITATNVYRNGELLRRAELGEGACPDEPYPMVLALEQFKVEELLTGFLQEHGVTVERKVDFKTLEQDEHGVRAWLQGPEGEEQVRCRYLVGCDGARSRVRTQLGIAFEGSTYPRAYTLGEVKVEWPLQEEMHRFLGEGETVVAVPMGAGRYRFAAWEEAGQWSGEEVNHGTVGSAPTLEQLAKKVERLAPGPVTLSHASSLMRYRVGLHLASNYRHGRGFLAGDAAHVHPPTGGQGMNTGLQDAYNLGWKLAMVLAGECPEALLDSYDAERRPVGQWVLSTTHEAANLEGRHSPSRFELGERRFYSLRNRLLMARWSQVCINYRHSPIIARPDAPRNDRELQAGDRAPDGMVPDPDGQPRRLFELFRGPLHHLLVLASQDDTATLALVSQLEERFGALLQVHRVWGEQPLAVTYQATPPTLVLVRPDGYIGAKVSGKRLDWLYGYLDNCFLTPVKSDQPAAC